ncbi:hypothetical protein ACQP00_38615 [Dactylosporangium sp. CS-047395]|uniref:hypothetical protein n=1 Tax=Dactylosporangium sp. CS-047395 TaxID=3239936 RepID=UPI003D93F5E5
MRKALQLVRIWRPFVVDAGLIASQVVPYLSAAAGAYGAAVVQRVSDETADATADAAVGLGRRLLRRLFGSSRGEQVRAAVVDLATNPADEGLADVMRAQVRAALTTDPKLLAEVARLVARPAPNVTVTGSQGVQIGDGNVQHNTFGAPPR